MKYIGKSHNLWHRMTLTLEKLILESNTNVITKLKRDMGDCYDFDQNNSNHQVTEFDFSFKMYYSCVLKLRIWFRRLITYQFLLSILISCMHPQK